jgi:hypothetical protein
MGLTLAGRITYIRERCDASCTGVDRTENIQAERRMFTFGKPRLYGDWLPDEKLAKGNKFAPPSDIKKRTGYSGRPGEHYGITLPIFKPHTDELEREMERYELHNVGPMYPPDTGIEETPFATVSAAPSKLNDVNYINTGKVSYITPPGKTKGRPLTMREDRVDRLRRSRLGGGRCGRRSRRLSPLARFVLIGCHANT